MLLSTRTSPSNPSREGCAAAREALLELAKSLVELLYRVLLNGVVMGNDRRRGSGRLHELPGTFLDGP